VVSSTIPTVRFLTSGSDFLDPPGLSPGDHHHINDGVQPQQQGA